MENITDINQLKMEVLKKTAEYSYKGILEDKVDDIPYEIIKGIKPQFRCCVFREREIIRQRIRLAMGKLPSNIEPYSNERDEKQVVHVIYAACEGCPIDRITVTGNCQNCLAHKCIKACRFGAITKTPTGAVIDPIKCKNCGQCVQACPYNAIVSIERPCKKACPVDAITYGENDLAYIDEERCINCGQCVIKCPFGAVSDISMITATIDEIVKENSNVYAMIAPAIEGQFGDVSVTAIKAAIKDLGFKDVVEVALGADAVAYREAEEVIENAKNGKKTTSSCCPAFVNLVEKHYPSLVENVSTTVSPMVATARHIKSNDPSAKLVFIGPCIAKKNEVISHYKNEIEYVLTFEELQAMFEVKEIDFSKYEGLPEEATKYGKGFAKSGGVTNAVLEVLEEKGSDINLKAVKCSGADECKRALLMLKNGRLTEDFIEGMACEQGCINGPAKVKDVMAARKIFDKYYDNKNEEIIQNNINKEMDKLNIHKH